MGNTKNESNPISGYFVSKSSRLKFFIKIESLVHHLFLISYLFDTVYRILDLIPDGWIRRFLLDAPFNSPPNQLDDCKTFVVFNSLAPLAMTPNAIAQQFQADTEKRAYDLDLKYPGSMSTQALKSYGKDGRYLVLVVGPFANLSDDFMVLCDFLGRARALEAI